LKLAYIPVPINAIIINGIIPRGISSVGKVLKKSKLPGNDQTVSKNGTPPIIKIEKIIDNEIIPRVDFFILPYCLIAKK